MNDMELSARFLAAIHKTPGTSSQKALLFKECLHTFSSAAAESKFI
jgi:hypothetical protein